MTVANSLRGINAANGLRGINAANGLRGINAANGLRGEAELVLSGTTLRLRPSFGALVAAEAELGPLFALVERAAAGGLTLAEMAALLWHCLDTAYERLPRDDFNEALVAGGIAAVTPALRVLLGQVLAGR